MSNNKDWQVKQLATLPNHGKPQKVGDFQVGDTLRRRKTGPLKTLFESRGTYEVTLASEGYLQFFGPGEFNGFYTYNDDHNERDNFNEDNFELLYRVHEVNPEKEDVA